MAKAKISKMRNQTLSPQIVLGVFETLRGLYPGTKGFLDHKNPFELLIAVILSAQCTDERVNLTTPALFKKYPSPTHLSKAKQSDVEKLIHACGFYRAKAKAIIQTAKDLVDKFSEQVPQTIEELVSLRGVGRKTASVVLSQAFGIPAIAVDTHVLRVSQRLGWTLHEDPVKIEMDLRELVPRDHWSEVNTLLILHGRRTCKSRKPLCDDCPIFADCPTGRLMKET